MPQRTVVIEHPNTKRLVELSYEEMDRYGDLVAWKRGALPDGYALDMILNDRPKS